MSVSEGEIVALDGYGFCEIVSRADPSLVTVRLPSGACVRIGHKALKDLVEESEHDD